MKLWPRLPLPRAQVILRDQAALDYDQLSRYWEEKSDVAIFAPVGGSPVAKADLESLRKFIVASAIASGYPGTSARVKRAAFDLTLSTGLPAFPIPIGEGLRPEVWAWIAVVLVPHILRWRWGGGGRDVPSDRGAGSIYRNAFARLWHAGRILDRGQGASERWGYLEAMGADQMVALLERPSLGSNPLIARAIADVWTRLPDSQRSERLFREAMKTFLISAAVVELDALTPPELKSMAKGTFEQTAARCGLACTLEAG